MRVFSACSRFSPVAISTHIARAVFPVFAMLNAARFEETLRGIIQEELTLDRWFLIPPLWSPGAVLSQIRSSWCEDKP